MVRNPWLLAALVLPLAACGGDDTTGDSGGDDSGVTDADVDTDTDADTDTDTDADTMAIVVTVDANYTVGALATIVLADWSVTDEITTVSTDPYVHASGEYLFQLNGWGSDNVRVYSLGDWAEPQAELKLQNGANPTSATMCGGKAFVGQYGKDKISIYDPSTWNLSGVVDLSSYSDADGVPETTDLLVWDGKLYAALQLLDNSSYPWVAVGNGLVVEIDCSTATVTQTFEVGPNPTLNLWPDHDGWLIVNTGDWYNSDYSANFDGGLGTLDLATGTWTETGLSEAGEGLNFNSVGMGSGTNGIVLATDADDLYGIYCLDTTDWSLNLLETTTSFLNHMAVNAQGEAWISARPSWTDSSSAGGLVVYDATDCSSMVTDGWLHLSLEPYGVAFY